MSHKIRIAIGGLGHETNTFSSLWTEYDDFRFVRGAAILEGGIGQPWAEEVQFLPTCVARADPGGLIRKTAYARLKEELLGELRAALPVEGVYLDLHGAMEVEEIGDGEGDLVSAVRALAGQETLISVSLDLHGNISPALVDRANILTALRTAPHRDGDETRGRALALLVRALRGRLRPVSVLVKPPLLLAGESAMTEAEPARSLYARLPEIAQVPGLMDASLLIGCAWTDSRYTSTSVIVVAERDKELAQHHAAGLAREVWARRRDFGFGMETAPLDEAIRQAMSIPQRPVFITDSGDNVTAGGAGDTPFCAERLLAWQVPDALVAGLADREAVQRCSAAGVGGEVRLMLGGKLDKVNGTPLPITGHVQALVAADQGQGKGQALAVVRVGGLTLILTADRQPFTNRASLTAAGIDPMVYKIVVVKQGYLFPDLADHVPRAIMALTPGFTDLRLEKLPYRYVPRPIFPLDLDLVWKP